MRSASPSSATRSPCQRRQVTLRKESQAERFDSSGMPAQLGSEDPLAVAPRRLLRHAGEARALPGGGVALHHEGAGVGRVAIVVRDEGAGDRFPERQREAVEGLGGPVPDIAVRERLHPGLEARAMALAHHAAGAVGAHQEIGVRQRGGIGAARAELEGHPAPAAMRLEHAEEGQPRDAGEAEAVDAHRLAAVDDGLLAPRLEPGREVGVGLGIRLGEKSERPVGEDHAPAIRRAGGILLDHADLVPRVGALEEKGQVESRRPAAHDGNPHAPSSTRSGRAGPIPPGA